MLYPMNSVGIYDPALIGDKPKWYSRDLTTISFNIIDETSTLGQAVNSFNAKSSDNEHTPTGLEFFELI
jgi:hypothetical protein